MTGIWTGIDNNTVAGNGNPSIIVNPSITTITAYGGGGTNSGSGGPGGSGGGGYDGTGGVGNKQTGTSTNIPSPYNLKEHADGSVLSPIMVVAEAAALAVLVQMEHHRRWSWWYSISNLYAIRANDSVGAPGPSPVDGLLVEVAEELIREVLVVGGGSGSLCWFR